VERENWRTGCLATSAQAGRGLGPTDGWGLFPVLQE
jgi:hypothetical protein